MSEFSDAFSGAWETSVRIFGDTITIGGSDFDCVVHLLNETNSVVGGKAGRTRDVQGTAIMSRTDWLTASGEKGIQVTIGDATYRVLNDPLRSYETDTVELQLGPLS